MQIVRLIIATFFSFFNKTAPSATVSSIICRYVFLMEMKKIEEKYQIFIKKGAGPEVDKQAAMIAKKYGVDELSKIAKLNFKNTEKVKNLLENK